MNTILLAELATPDVNLPIILPEIIVALAGVIVMLYDSFFPRQRNVTGTISLIGLAIAAFFLVSMWTGETASAWGGMIVTDNLRMAFSIVFLLVTALTILISTVWVERENVPVGEYHALLLFGTFGMMLMASGNDLVILFLGLEAISLRR
jgi:NADH-quinone oxidoreductase subunit N